MGSDRFQSGRNSQNFRRQAAWTIPLAMGLLLVIAAGNPLAAQSPAPTITSILKATDNSAPPVAPGSYAVALGSLLASAVVSSPALPWQTTLNSVVLTVNGVAAPLTLVSPGQINFQVPYATAIGTATVVVTNGTSVSNPFRLNIVPAAPGLFSAIFNNSPGSGQNSATNTVTAGNSVQVLFTGLGVVSPPVADGVAAGSSPPSTSTLITSAAVNGVTVTPTGVELAPGTAAEAQANVPIPGNLATGSYTLTLTVNGVTSAAATVFVTGLTPPVITTTSLPVGVVGQAYPSTTLTASGGSGSFTWSVVLPTSFPPGLLVSPAGILSGTPTGAGSYLSSVIGVVDNVSGQTVRKTFAITILNPSSISLLSGGSASPLPSTYGQALTLTANVTGGAAGDKITFYDGSAIVGTAKVGAVAPVANLVTRLLGSGTHKLTARYDGNATTAPSTSNTVSQTVNTLPQGGFGAAADNVVGGSATSVVTGDFNGDGNTDIAVATSGGVNILLGNGKGGISSNTAVISIPATGAGIAAGDFNGDGFTDLALGSASSNSVTILTGNGLGTFSFLNSATTPAPPSGVVVADFNGDGLPDLASSLPGQNTFAVNLGNGDGTFQAPVLSSNLGISMSTGIAAADFNGDGKTDLVYTLGTGSIGVALGNGDGTFGTYTTIAAGTTPTSVVAADLNGDGKIDIAVANLGSGTVSVFLGNGDGTFQAQAVYSAIAASSLAVADVNNDGLPDLIVVGSTSGTNITILLGQANGTFLVGTPVSGGFSLDGIVVADFNNDGRPDLAVADFGGTANNGSGANILLGTLPQPTVTCPTLPPTLLTGTTYSIACAGSGSVSPYFLSIATGTLPAGTNFTPATGILGGTPTTTGPYTFSLLVADSDTPVQSSVQSFTVTVYNPISFTTSSLPNSAINSPYPNTQFAATGGSGTYSWSATGLPTGLSITALGLLAGTPTQSGAFPNVQVTATDVTAGTSKTVTFSFTIYTGVSITNTTLHADDLGSAYTAVQFAATGGSGTYTWAATGLPGGLNLSTSGLLNGTPTAQGTFSTVQVTAHDVNSGQNALATFSITIYNTLTISTPSPLPNAVTGSLYPPVTFIPSGGSGTFTWAATGLPTGLSLSTAGVLGGTATATGAFNSVNVTVTDTLAAVSVTQTYSITVYNPVTITTASLPHGLIGTSYTAPTLIATGGSGSYTWSSATLPPGITITAGGVLGGAPTSAGTFPNVSITATDSTAGLSASKIFTVIVYNPVTVTTSSFPAGVAGQVYPGATMTATGGSGTYTWTATGIPGGLTLSAAGALTGTPSAAALSSVILTATDATAGLSGSSAALPLRVWTPLLITTPSLPRAITGQFYSASFGSSGGSGTATWTATGLPATITADTSGNLLGTPTVAGTYPNVIATVTDATAGLNTSKTFTLNVYNPLSITTSSLPNGVTGQAYPATTLTFTGGSGTVTWAATGLPANLSLSAAGVLTGTPATAGSSPNVQITATDATASLSASVTLSLTVYNQLLITTTSLPRAITGQFYSSSFTASGGSGTATWTATGLPSTITADASGNLVGTPTVAGTYPNVNATVTDANAGQNASKIFTLNVYNPLSITTSSLPNGVTGQAYPSTTLTVTGGSGTVTWAATGLPANLSLSTAGVLTGTPAAAGSTPNIQITATDATAGLTASATLSVAVYNALSITTSSLPNGTTNVTYPAPPLAATGGSGTYTWSATGLPAGLSLTPAGVWSGAPSAVGTSSNVQITVTDATATQNNTKTYSIAVYNGLTITTSSLPFGVQNKTYTAPGMTASGGSGTYTWSASGLPPGISLSAGGAFSGAPNTVGTSTQVQITVTDATAGLTAVQSFSITIYPTLVINTLALPNVVQGQPVPPLFYLTAVGGSGAAVTWIATGLPTGVGLSTAGLLTGTPTVSGAFSNVVATATDTLTGQTATQTYSISVAFTTTMALQSSGAPSTFGSPVTLTAKVTPATATGKVTFYDGTTVLGTSTLASGTATFTTPLLSAGTRNLSAYYLGTPLAAPSASSPLVQTVKVLPEVPFAAPVIYSTGTGSNPNAVAVADFNGDGKADVVVVNGNTGSVGIYLGTGTGTLSLNPIVVTTDSQPGSVAIGDFNGDGKPDIAVTSVFASTIDVLLGNGDGTFQTFVPYNVGPAPGQVIVSDFNRDGFADLVTTQSDGTVGVLLGNGDGTFQAAANYSAGASGGSLASGDFNGDGKADLAVANYSSGTVNILLGDGLGGFSKPASLSTGTNPAGITVADFNGDSKLDLTFFTTSGVGVALGNGDGTFQPIVNYPAGNTPGAIAVGDFLGSGNLAIAVTASVAVSGVSVLAGKGDGTFTGPVNFSDGGTTPSALAVTDLNGDGRSDLVVANLNSNTLSVLLGQIPPPPSVSCTLPVSPVLTGTAYNFPCAAKSGIAPYTYSITTGSLPTGLSISPSTGAITGTPTAVGTFTFTVKAVDSDTPLQNATFSGSIFVAAPLVTSASPLPGGIFGVTYSTTLASGGTAPYTCSVSTGALPAGLTLNAATCVLSGTPTLGGVYTFTLGITDSGTPAQTASPVYSLTVSYPVLTISTATLPFGVQNQPYTALNLTATGGSGSYSWSATGLPTGLTLSAAGVLSGTPTVSGTFATVAVTLTDSQAGATANKTYSLLIYAPLVISTTSLPVGITNGAYPSTTLAATGGSGTYIWTATGLPAGLTLTTGGLLSGTPTTAGTSASVKITVADSTASLTTQQTYTINVYNPLSITTSVLPNGTATLVYAGAALGVSGGSGSVLWSATGVPPGLTVSPAGIVSGTPTTPGTYSSFSITATDATASQTAQKTYPVVIAYPPLVMTSSSNLGGVGLGSTLSFTPSATGGKPPYTWSTVGSLPVGVSVNPATGLITATPVTFGSFSFNLQVTDAQPVSTPQTVSFTVLAITSSATPPPAVTGAAYSFTFVAQGGATTTYTWNPANGSTLPPGLTLTALGVLQGTPTQTGTFNFSVVANDGISPEAQSVTLAIYNPLSITTSSLPNGSQNVSYGPVNMQATGGSGTYLWSGTGLPSGVAITSAGIVGGIPTASTVAPNVSITVADATAAQSASKNYQITIAAPVPPVQPTPPVPPLVISGPTSLGGVPLGGSISGAFSASGGKFPYTWAASGLPAGVSVNYSTGAVTGKPTVPGTYTFQIQVYDAASSSQSLQVTFTVLGITTTALPPAILGQTYSQTIGAAGGSGQYSFSGSGLPPGLTLSSSGTVAGKATAAGTYTIGATVTDSTGLAASAGISIAVNTPGPLTISSASLPDGVVAQPYSQTLGATGGLPSYTWSQTGGALPDGLSLGSTGTLFGSPIKAGHFSFAVQVTDAAGATAIASIAVYIKPLPLVLTGSLPAGVVNADYPTQIFSASGGVQPYTYSIQGTLPDGLTFSNGVLTGTPTSASTYSFSIVATDSVGATALLPASVLIKAVKADLILSGGTVSFAVSTGSAALPAPASITVRSSDVATVIGYSTAFTAAPWLSVATGAATPSNISISLTAAALSLTASTTPYTSTITVTCTATSCAGKSQAITVSLSVTSPPPQLGVDTSLLSFSATPVNPVSSSQGLSIQNIGGGSLGFSSISAADSWVSVGAFPSSLAGGVIASVPITVNPAGLTPGYYRSTVTVTSSAGNATVVITLLLSADATMTLGPAGAQFSMPAGSTLGNPNGSFLVAVSGSLPVAWSASVLPGAPWLILGTSTGSSVGSAPATVSFSIDSAAAAALAPGAYYGTIEVTSSGVVNTPQDFQVVLSISAPASAVQPDPEPAGLIFLTGGATSLPPQIVQVFASSKTSIPYQASASTTDGASWLNVTPATGATQTGSPARSSVSVNLAGLSPGIYRGGVSYAFSASAVRTVNVTLVVQGGAPSPASRGIGISAAGCTPAQLVPTQTGLVSNFAAPASWPTPLAISLIDNCGTAVAGGQIVATFSNGDPPQVLSLVDGNAGLYSATWTPRKASSQVTIAAKATAPGFPAATAQITGQVTPNVAPALNPHGTLHIFNPLVGGALSPGNIVQIYGTGLAAATGAPTAIPLPTAIGGSSVIIGGIQSPLYYVSAGQINAQIPFELAPGKQYQVIVSANGAVTTPDSIQISDVSPGIAAFGTGEIIAQHGDGSLVTDAAPAAPGEYIVFYLAGLGLTDNPVTTGAASPADPLARPSAPPNLTIGGEPVNILFAGLTPGLVGLYQVNAQIPADAPDGQLKLIISQNGAPGNSTILPVKH